MRSPISISPEQAAEIMGGGFIGCDDIERLLSLQYTNEDIVAMLRVPFSQRSLERAREDFVLVAGYPTSLVSLCRRLPHLFRGNNADRWRREPFAVYKKVEARWYLVRRSAIPLSFGKSYNEQRTLLGREEVVPHACEVVFVMLAHFLATGERLLGSTCCRCVDRRTDEKSDNTIGVSFLNDGISISSYPTSLGLASLGLASRLTS